LRSLFPIDPLIYYPKDVEDLSLEDRIIFVNNWSQLVIEAMLGELSQVLDDAHRRIAELPDGRIPLEARRYLIASLADLWHQLGRRPTPGRRSKFGQFCEDVFAGFGLPTEGVNAALSDGISTWRREY
jgi:hypothetical protein